MIKSKFKRVTSLFLATLMCDHFLQALARQQHMLLREKKPMFMVDFPRDGDANYDGVWGHNNLTLKKWLAYRTFQFYQS